MDLMYVPIEVAHQGVPMGSGVQLGLGEGPIKSGSNVSTPRVPHVTHADSYSRKSAFCRQLYSGQLRVSCILM